MGYRRDKGKALEWRRWLEANRVRLNGSGVPNMVFEHEGNWRYFVDHGYFSPDGTTTIIDVDKMPKEEALRLCEFLEEDERGEPRPSSALNRLQYLLGRGKHAR